MRKYDVTYVQTRIIRGCEIEIFRDFDHPEMLIMDIPLRYNINERKMALEVAASKDAILQIIDGELRRKKVRNSYIVGDMEIIQSGNAIRFSLEENRRVNYTELKKEVDDMYEKQFAILRDIENLFS